MSSGKVLSGAAHSSPSDSRKARLVAAGAASSVLCRVVNCSDVKAVVLRAGPASSRAAACVTAAVAAAADMDADAPVAAEDDDDDDDDERLLAEGDNAAQTLEADARAATAVASSV